MSTIVPENQQLQQNPQLPQHPLGAYTDAQYEAQVAALKSNISKQYADILQQLGHIDPQTGQFIMGSVETEANRQKALLSRNMGLAREDVTHQHQQLGTLFSGLRGTDQARAEFPFNDQIGQIETQTPLTLSQLYERGAGLSSDYAIGDNQLLADAASRRAAGLMTSGAGGVSGSGTGTSTGTDTGTGTGTTAPTDFSGVMATTTNAPDTTAIGNLIEGVPSSYGTPYDPATGDGLHLFSYSGPAYSQTTPTVSPSNDTLAYAPTTAPAPAPTTDTSGISDAAKRKLLQWG